MSSTPEHPGPWVAPVASSAGLARALRRARQLTGADVVLLRPAGGVDAIGADGTPAAVRRARERPLVIGAPDASVAAETREPAGRRTVVPIGFGPDVPAWLEFVGDATWAVDARVDASMRVLAGMAGCLFDGRGALRRGIAEDRVVLTAGRALTDLALVAETYDELLGGITAALAVVLDAEKVGIAVVDERGFLRALPGSFGASPELVASSQVSRDELTTAAGGVFRTGRPKLANDPEREIPRFLEWVEGFGIRRLMTLPMLVSGQPRGVVHVANGAVPFTTEHARIAERMTPFVAGAVEQVTQRLRMRRREAIGTVVGRAATAIATGEHRGRLDGVLDEVRRVLGASRAAIVFEDDAPPVVAGPGSVLPEADGIVLRTPPGDGPAVRDDAAPPDAPGSVGWSALRVPVLVDGARQATLGVVRVPYEPFTDHERAALGRVANVVSLSLTTDRYRSERARTARMAERQRIADDLHDHVAQVLFSGKLALQGVLEQLDDGAAARPGIVRARDLMVRSEVSIREVIEHLADDRGGRDRLADRLGDVLREVEEQFGLTARIDAAPEGTALLDGLPEGPAEALVVTAREALVNAAKHAGPCAVSVSLRVTRAGRVELAVVDDGRGVAAGTADGYGLRAVRRRLGEHDGTLSVSSGQERGTAVLATVPTGPPAPPTAA